MISHADALKVLGELDGITLRSINNIVTVSIDIDGKEIELIKTSGEIIDHHITRHGILCEISKPRK